MKRGPKPKSEALRDRPRRRAKEKEPAPFVAVDPNSTQPSEWLDAAAKQEWRRVVGELERLLLFTVLDRSALEQYCLTYSLLKKAVRALNRRKSLMMTVGENGHRQVVPELAEVKKLSDELRKWVTEFGMTPASRSGIFGKELKPVPPAKPAGTGAQQFPTPTDDEKAEREIFDA